MHKCKIQLFKSYMDVYDCIYDDMYNEHSMVQ